MKLSDVIRLGRTQSEVLSQPDGAITLEQAVALQTASLVRSTEVLRALLTEQRRSNAALLMAVRALKGGQ